MKKHRKTAPPAIVFQSSEDDEKILAQTLESPPPCAFKTEKPAPSAFKKTKKQRFLLETPEATLDLHGNTREEALARVEKFITRSHKRGLSVVLIVTGKGYHSGNKGPVLNQAVRSWLKENSPSLIKKFAAAPSKYGGTGALLVHLP